MGSSKHGVACTNDLFTQTKVAQCVFCVLYIYKWTIGSGWDKGWFTVFCLEGMPRRHRKNDWPRTLNIDWCLCIHRVWMHVYIWSVDLYACSPVAWKAINWDSLIHVYYDLFIFKRKNVLILHPMIQSLLLIHRNNYL